MSADDSVQIDELLTHAPQLQALARLLVSEWDSQDVVQEAWVRTIANPPKTRANLRSWLSSAVRNRAADHHKHEASQRRRIEAAELKGAAIPTQALSPEESLAQSEAHRAVVTALNELEEPFRHALLLHYFQGLTLSEIATQLNEPKSTIHSRLESGRERLRERLHARYGKDAFGMCALATNLPRSTAAVLFGTPTTWVAAFIAGIAALFAVNHDWNPDAPPNIAATSAQSPLPSSLEPIAPAHLIADASDSFRIKDTQTGEIAADEIVFRGRCIAASNGQALQGAKIEMTWSGTSYPELEFLSPANWTAPSNLTTDADGRFEIRIQENFSKRFTLEIRPDEYAVRRAYLNAYREPDEARIVDLGEIHFARGYQLSGNVVDQNGHPPADRLRVIALDLPVGIESAGLAVGSLMARTETDGTFIFEDLVPEGTWNVEISDHAAYSQIGVTEVEINGADSQVTLQGAARPSIRGTIRNADGSIPPRMYLWRAQGTDRGLPGLATWSLPDGSFALFGDEDTPPPFLQLGTLHPVWKSDERIHWETRDLNIRLNESDPSSALSFTVEHAESSRAITDFAVQFSIVSRPGYSESPPRLIGPNSYSNGVTHLNSPVGHPFEFTVIPQERGLLASSWLSSEELDFEAGPIQVQLEDLDKMDLKLVDSDLSPVPGVLVQIIEYADKPPTIEQRHFEYGRAKLNYGFALIDQARADQNGHVSIYARDDLDITLRITTTDSVFVIAPFSSEQSGELRLSRVEEAEPFKVRFELTRSAGWPRAGVIMNPDDNRLRIDTSGGDIAWFDEDGMVEIVTTKLGPHFADLVVASPRAVNPIPLFTSRLKFSIGEGDPLLVHFDPTPFLPGSLNGRVLFDGAMPAGGYVTVRSSQNATELHPAEWPSAQLNTSSTSRIELDQDGRFTFPHLLPGMVEVRYSDSDSGYIGMFPVASPDSAMILSGNPTQADFTIRYQGMRIQINHSDGTPYELGEIRVRMATSGYTRSTDESGMLELDGITPDGVRLQRSGIGESHLGTFKPAPGQRWTEHELTLPE